MKLRHFFRNRFKSVSPVELQPPDDTALLIKEAQVHQENGRFDEAASLYRAVLAFDTLNLASLTALASIALERGHLDEALDRYGKLIAMHPGRAEYHFKRGNAYNRSGILAAALNDYSAAVELDSGYANAFCNRGTVLERLERLPEALTSYERAIALNPADAFAHYNRAGVMRRIGRLNEALASFDQAVAIDDAYIQAYVNRGRLLHELGRHELAAASYGKALELGALQSTSPFTLRPELKYLLGLKRLAQMQICDWQSMNADLEAIALGVRAGLAVTLPLPLLAMLDEPSLHRAAAESWIREEMPPEPAAIPKRSQADKIRLGYFSADFRVHPVAYLMAGVFEHHDRSKFELTAFAFGPDSDDVIRMRISKAFDRFIDVEQRTDAEVAALARELGIDIAINLNGFTENSRTGVFARRAAPRQINFLGYPGTMGASFMDYLIADEIVIPPDRRNDYAEEIIYLPGSFMPFDSGYEISDKVFAREELGLPSEGFVFCCFNNYFKLTPQTFDCWMRILTRVENSVLWLGSANAAARANLCREASRRGIDERRLVFADRMKSLPDHLARLRAADLFLDTFPYNAHATALDALWAGLPLVTCAGSSFPSRIASSLLSAAGLPELACASLPLYEQMAVDLASDPARLARTRARLERNRFDSILFDTARYTKKLEHAFETLVDRGTLGVLSSAK